MSNEIANDRPLHEQPAAPPTCPSDSSDPSYTSDPPAAPGQPPTPNPEPPAAPVVPYRRRGQPPKVLSLSLDIQNLVNEELLKGTTFQAIVDLLAEKGHPDFSVQNISRWSTGGFRHWVLTQTDAAEHHARRHAALNLVRENGYRLDQAALQMALGSVCELVSKFDSAPAQEVLHEKPEQFFTLFNALSRLVTRNNALEHKKISSSISAKTGGRPEPRRKGGLTLEQRDCADLRLGVRPDHPPVSPSTSAPEDAAATPTPNTP